MKDTGHMKNLHIPYLWIMNQLSKKLKIAVLAIIVLIEKDNPLA